MALQLRHVLAWLEALQQTYADNRQYLTDLDAAIGDGRLGRRG